MINNTLIDELIHDAVKPVFHFKRTVPKRIKNIFKFQNLVNVDWLILVRQKVNLPRTLHFDTRIDPEVRGFVNLFNLRMLTSTFRCGTVEVENWLNSQ